MHISNRKTMNNFRLGVIFDVDGTMVDNALYHEKAWIETSRKYGLQIDSAFYHTNIHARSNDNIVRRLLGDDITEEQIVQVGNDKESLYRKLFRPAITEVAGLKTLLQALTAAKVPVAAASNSPAANVDFALDALKIRHFFAAVVDRDQVSVGKPAPELLLTAAARIQVEPANCIVFEDSISGFQAAANAGMTYIAITEGSGPADREHASSDAAAVFENYLNIDLDLIQKILHQKK